MTVRLNHTIVPCLNKVESAEFLSRILGLGVPGSTGHFATVEVANDVSLDFDDATDVRSMHLAFLVDEEEFDPIFNRILEEGVEYFADPSHQRRGEINTRHEGRGFYFADPSGHNLEVLTRK
jgi:catechol 2,3-dioxygenase-like lactoylglutathione lyase family enzyme